MVSGGVGESNVKEYVELGVTGICLGSAMLGDWLAKGGPNGLAKHVRKFVKLVEEAVSNQPRELVRRADR